MQRRFQQVDVFTTTPYAGNPVAVVLDADGLSTQDMQRFARWTNLSETTFVLPPLTTGADYRIRIFTGSGELPFAGHPTLGTCHAWLATSGQDHPPEVIVQECGVGLIPIRRSSKWLSFAAPPLIRSGPVSEEVAAQVIEGLRIDPAHIVNIQWVDNGPGWVAALLDSADAVLSVDPGPLHDLKLGIVGPHPAGSPEAFEVRGFFPTNGVTIEDPVTGSLNASVAQWLLATGRATAPYVARQGTVLGRSGQVHVSTSEDGAVWVGGGTITCIAGHVEL